MSDRVLTLEDGGPYLVPHPWDAVGPPPPPGRPYDPDTDPEVAARLDAAVTEYLEASGQYEFAEEEKERAEDDMREAEKRIEAAEEVVRKEGRADWLKDLERGDDPRKATS